MDSVVKKLGSHRSPARHWRVASRAARRFTVALARAATTSVLAILTFGLAALIVTAAAISGGLVGIAGGAAATPVTKLVLDFALQRYVARHARSIEAPKLDAIDWITRGAGHYTTSCEACHRGPGVERARLAAALHPAPVDLSLQGSRWTAAELFWIIKNGIPLSGMPAWGSLYTDKEIWQIVSIVQRLPQMSAQEYSELQDVER